MPCYHPLQAWRGKVLPSGKRSIVFKRGDAAPSLLPFPMKLPCGQCIGCRLERSRQWALRCLFESKMYKENCFITLTYNDANLPSDGSLDLSHFQKFMKRLRKVSGRSGIRFFHCGEYGEDLGRPHYHACLFNYDFPDRKLWSVRNGIPLFTSEILSKVWPFGFSLIGDVTFESAAYVARYIMKKITGDDAVEHYVNEQTGVVLKPEYVTMSRGCKSLGTGGIGKSWFDKFKLDVYPHDYVVSRGMKMKPPRYFDSVYDAEDPSAFKAIKSRRVARCSVTCDHFIGDRVVKVDDNDVFRLHAKEVVKRAQISSLKRTLEDGL